MLSYVFANARRQTTAEKYNDDSVRKVVITYEHRAAMAKRVRCSAFFAYAESDRECTAVAGAAGVDFVDVVCYRGDGTQQEAIDKEKVHTSLMSVVASPLEVGGGCTGAAYDAAAAAAAAAALSAAAHLQSAAGDLQTVKHGTGQETYEICKRQFASVAIPNWEERAASAHDSRRLSFFWLGLDNGPDNVGMVKRIQYAIRNARHVAFGVVWCFHHQAHLIAKAALETVEGFAFRDEPLQIKYWTSLSSIAYVWRSPGVSRKIVSKAEDLGYDVGPFMKMPCRPIKGRWGVVSELELKVIQLRGQLGPVMAAILPARAAARSRARAIGAEEDLSFQEHQKTLRTNCRTAASGTMFYVSAIISSVARSPITQFQSWMMKRTAEHNGAQQRARQNDKVTVGAKTNM